MEKLKDIVKVPYYYVGACPNCDSEATGRFIPYYRDADLDYVIQNSLKNGELVAVGDEHEHGNLFCNDCGNVWYGPVKRVFLSLNEIEYQRFVRDTDRILAERKAIKEQEETTEKGGVMTAYKKFMGRL